MRVLMFVSNPLTNDPRVYNEAVSLLRAGHQVAVIARDWASQNPSQEDLDGIEVVRVQTPLTPRQGFGGPSWTAVGLVLWQLRAYRRALSLHKEIGFDAVHCHDLDTLMIGVALKRKLALPLIYDAHEIYGYMMTRHFPMPVASVFLRLEKRLLKYVDHVINVAEPQRQYFSAITDKPISLVLNCKPLRGHEYRSPPSDSPFTILYIGVLHAGRAITMLVDVVSDLADVRCVIGGIGQPEFVRDLAERCRAVSNVEFIGVVPTHEVIPMTESVHAVFIVVNPGDMNNRMGLANKQFEAMVCGRPTICTKGTYSGEMTELEQVGLTVECEKEALKQAIVRLRDDTELREELGRNALRAAIAKYNWQRQEEKLLEIYESIKPSAS